jgi:hypothetical protein
MRAEAIIQSVAGADVNANVLLIMVQVFERTNRLPQAIALLEQLSLRPDSRLLGSDLQRVSAKIAQRRGDNELAVALYR